MAKRKTSYGWDLNVVENMGLSNPTERSVPMTLRQAAHVFGYRSDNGVKNQANRIGLAKQTRASWTFILDVLTTDQRRRYEDALANGDYNVMGKRL